LPAWQRLASHSKYISQVLRSKPPFDTLADVGIKEIEESMEGNGQLVHSFLSEHPAGLKLRKKDIRVMEWGDQCYSLELSLTLTTLVRHQNDNCTVCPTSLNADLKTSVNVVKRAPDTGRPAHMPPRLWRIAGLTTSRSTGAIGQLRFGSWLLLPTRTPPIILTMGVQLDLEVRTPSISRSVCR
jgi:hypothetical protein